jgi:hypothetical protein
MKILMCLMQPLHLPQQNPPQHLNQHANVHEIWKVLFDDIEQIENNVASKQARESMNSVERMWTERFSISYKIFTVQETMKTFSLIKSSTSNNKNDCDNCIDCTRQINECLRMKAAYIENIYPYWCAGPARWQKNKDV